MPTSPQPTLLTLGTVAVALCSFLLILCVATAGDAAVSLDRPAITAAWCA
jgi:hypothetical protein